MRVRVCVRVKVYHRNHNVYYMGRIVYLYTHTHKNATNDLTHQRRRCKFVNSNTTAECVNSLKPHCVSLIRGEHNNLTKK